ncbi:MAG TPA: hypothetical protein VGR35_12040 [Tepidisphaeraceae bacterium]|nr:hypothetical protein [Tepidisphaeraceae bacterium]
MSFFARVFGRIVQDQLLACLDEHGAVADAGRLIEVLKTHAPELVHERYVNDVVEQVMELWVERQQEREAAAFN